MRVAVLVLSGFLASSLLSDLALGRDDPLEVLCIVPSGTYYYNQIHFRDEPLVDPTFIPASEWQGFTDVMFSSDQVRRHIRKYFPRSYDELVEEYEFIMFRPGGGHITCSYLSPGQWEMMREAVEKGGLGGLAPGSVLGALAQFAEQWARCSFSDAFPNDADGVIAASSGRISLRSVFRERTVINEDLTLPPVFTPYKDLLSPQQGSNPLMISRPGSQTYVWAVTENRYPGYHCFGPGTYPFVLGWRYGEGYTWSLAGCCRYGIFLKQGVYTDGPYVYGRDALYGMLYYSTGRESPEDVVMVHNLRESFGEYAEAMAFIYAMIDFVEKYEVNTNHLFLRADALRDKWREGRRLYFAQEWEDSRTILEQLVRDVRVFTKETLRFKDEALLLVYVMEWLAVTGTFLFSGFVLWSLMVRRRLYREVEQIRLKSVDALE